MKKWILAAIIGIVLVVAGSIVVYEVKSTEMELLVVEGPLELHGDDYYVNRMELNFGDGRLALGDYNGDGRIDPINREMFPLVGKSIIVKGYRNADPDDYYEIYVTEINNQEYPNPRVERYNQGWKGKLRQLLN